MLLRTGPRPGRTETQSPVHRDLGDSRRRHRPSAVTRFADEPVRPALRVGRRDPRPAGPDHGDAGRSPAGPVLGPAAAPPTTSPLAHRCRAAVLTATPRAARLDEPIDSGERLLHEQSRATAARTLVRRTGPLDGAVFGEVSRTRASDLTAPWSRSPARSCPDGTTAAVGPLPPLLRATEGAFTCLSERARTSSSPATRPAPTATRRSSRSAPASAAAPSTSSGTPTAEGGVIRLAPAQGGQQGHMARAQRPGARSPTRTRRRSPTTASTCRRRSQAVHRLRGDRQGEAAAVCTGVRVERTARRCASSSSAARRSPAASSAARAAPARCASSRRVGRERCGDRRPRSTRTSRPAPTPTRPTPGEGRKLLAFSDSRQAAAYFAPYLEDSYGRLQRRRLITEGLLDRPRRPRAGRRRRRRVHDPQRPQRRSSISPAA